MYPEVSGLGAGAGPEVWLGGIEVAELGSLEQAPINAQSSSRKFSFGIIPHFAEQNIQFQRKLIDLLWSSLVG